MRTLGFLRNYNSLSHSPGVPRDRECILDKIHERLGKFHIFLRKPVFNKKSLVMIFFLRIFMDFVDYEDNDQTQGNVY